MKHRHVVIEKVTVLHEPVGPTPRHVQVLRFVRVESIAEDQSETQSEGGRDHRRRGSQNFPHPLKSVFEAEHIDTCRNWREEQRV